MGSIANDLIAALYSAANVLQKHHESSLEQLQELMANLGLLQVDLPKDLDQAETDFVKHLILLQAIKATLWNQLQRVHDELNPI